MTNSLRPPGRTDPRISGGAPAELANTSTARGESFVTTMTRSPSQAAVPGWRGGVREHATRAIDTTRTAIRRRCIAWGTMVPRHTAVRSPTLIAPPDTGITTAAG